MKNEDLMMQPPQIKYPNIRVKLVGKDGNAFRILGTVLRALRHAKVPQEQRDEFLRQATSGNYTNLLTTCMEWVDVN